MKSEIGPTTNFAPIRLEIIFETPQELQNFCERLKAAGTVTHPIAHLIRQLEAFKMALEHADKSAPIQGNLTCPQCKDQLWGWPNRPMPLHCRNSKCSAFMRATP